MNRPPRNTLGLLAAVAASLALTCIACDKPPSKLTPVPSTIKSTSDLKPDVLPGERAFLVLAGSRLPVQVRARRDQGYFTLELVSHDEVLEAERYLATEKGLWLFEATRERYDPPLPLVKYPLRIGDTWEWSGTLDTGNITHKARASVMTDQDRLNVEGFDDDAVRVRAELTIEGGGQKPAERTLTFWIVPGKGILRREFGQASTRIPAAPAETPVEGG